MFFCKCLNVGIEIKSHLNGTKTKPKVNAVPGIQDYESLEFIKSALGPFIDFSSATHHDALVKAIKYDKWMIHKCLNCDVLCYATSKLPTGGEELIVNAELVCDEAQLNSLINCDKYSMPFKIILQPIEALTKAHQLLINEDPCVKSLFGKLQAFIANDSERIDAEIRKLTLEKNQRRQKAEQDFHRLVALIEMASGSSTTTSSTSSSSTKIVSNDDIESLTPPVTPESNDKMSIDDQLQIKSPRDGHAKHNNAIAHQQRITRVINFEDNIFELDGMQQQEDPENDVDRYHKYSDTEEDDMENIIEKRAMRGRVGSIHLARSAPISMANMNHHHHIAAIDIDDDNVPNNRAVNDETHQMDIASSIKMLARSVHASDAVFGELPARRLNKF